MNNLSKTIITLFAALVLSLPSSANTDHIMFLNSEMLRLIGTDDRDQFYRVTEELKQESLDSGNLRLYYTAWGNEAVFEATKQNYPRAFEIVQELLDAANSDKNVFGEYMAMHTKAVIELQKQDYDAAEVTFQQAVDYRHRYFPDESAADDLQELMKIANHRRDPKAGAFYARQILNEPNVAPIHKGRALFRLSQLAFNKNDSATFNGIYRQMMQLKAETGIGTVEPVVEVNYNIINGNYEEALRLSDELSAKDQAERRAIIYHRMGDDTKAYDYMTKFKKISDSITLVSHGNVVASCYVQMNNERMRLEQNLLQRENNRLHIRVYLVIAISVFVLLVLLVCQRQMRVVKLKRERNKLKKEKQQAEQALDVKNEFLNNISNELRTPLCPITGFTDILGETGYSLNPDERNIMRQHIKDNSLMLSKMIDEMAELSFYESKKSLPMTAIRPNILCNHLVDAMKMRCQPGVVLRYESSLADDFTIQSNFDALEKVLTHLLENAIRHTSQGSVTIAVTLMTDQVLFSVTDTGTGISEEQRSNIFKMFAEQGEKVKYLGMGLSICQAIMKLLGGRIWLDENYKMGACFCFELPL